MDCFQAFAAIHSASVPFIQLWEPRGLEGFWLALSWTEQALGLAPPAVVDECLQHSSATFTPAGVASICMICMVCSPMHPLENLYQESSILS